MNKNLLLRNSLIFGISIALICFLVALIQFYGLGKSPFGKYKMPAFGINLLLTFFSIWYYRQKNNGLLSFTEGFSVGFLTNLLGSIFAGIMFYFFSKFVDNQSLTLWMQENIQNIEKIKLGHIKNFGIADYEQLLAQAKILPTPSDVLIDEIVKKQLCVVGVTIFSIILRKHQT